MVINFRTRGISQGARKLTRTPTLIKKKRKKKESTLLTYLGSLGVQAITLTINLENQLKENK
jgi:hypothetical protein